MAGELHCSFCGYSDADKRVKAMVKADLPTRPREAAICDVCALECVHIICMKEGSERYKKLASHVMRFYRETQLFDIDEELLRINADRDNLIFDIGNQETKGSTDG